ncbi:MAG: AI-2E family transporter [Bryobacteraceae bacterium]|nr:AI-2E family transporter [Bryobacteraceae bacterium]
MDDRVAAEVERKDPDLDDLKQAFVGPLGIRSLALTGLFILATFYTLYFARHFFLPVVLALLFSFLLQPAVRALEKVRIPPALGALLVLIGLLGGIGLLGYTLSGPVATWLVRVPETAQKMESKLRALRKPVEQVTEATKKVEQLANAGAPAGAKPPQQVALKEPSLLESLLSQTFSVVFGAAVLIVLLYFLLASGDLFLRKLVKVMPTLSDKKKAVEIAREIEGTISHYLFIVAAINFSLGLAAAGVFWLLGLPNPLLWGLLGGILNFVPYLGAMTTIAIITLVAAATFPTVWQIALVPVSYFILEGIEGNVLTPWVLGQRLTLNPVMVFLSLTFWGWIWGIPGALLAVPMLAVFKIVCDRIEPLAPIGEFLGQ